MPHVVKLCIHTEHWQATCCTLLLLQCKRLLWKARL